ncbi:PSD1 and planctomycete cytochrome C domain-containing protein [Verrucomicrobiales bacterium BCK34]|nr:PSD1 and planctomycete cytochrome C domain-containing protein [Verrucomicrobiales bacterium BCK34]
MIGLLLMVASVAHAQPKGKMSGTEYFEKHVRPILVKHCYECHSEAEEAQKGGLLLDRESAWLEGGDSGKAVVPGSLEASLLITAVVYEDPDFEMPPKYKLEDSEIELLKKWVGMGAPGPAEDMGDTEFSQLGNQEVIFEKAAGHWAFQPVDAPAPPEVENKAWNAHPVDRFIFAKLAENGLTPSPQADARTLTRRVSYALTGLPPRDEDTFEKSPEALIDDLLASPQYGEHVGRVWLDVARYADTASTYRPDTKTPHYYPYAFTFRDYVIDAFNSDKRFDQFVKEQLAADLIVSENRAPELAALGFLGVSPHRNKSHDFVDDAIDATTRGFMGMTVSCSRCHDHKFEPIPTADYYSLYGVFNSVNRPEPWDINEFPVIDGYDPDEKLVADYKAQNQAIQKKIKDAGASKKGNNRSVAEAIKQTELAQLLVSHDGAPARAMSVSEREKPENAFIFVRGEPANRGDRVPRRFLKILDAAQPEFTRANSGRLELAEKIIDPENPLTARVYVNRIWGMLMGDYIVDTPSDFGLQGEAPSHPELLDYLAAEFVENGWSTKYLVKLIVTSKTFRQSSRTVEASVEVDPQNQLYWRANRKRLRIEELRDSLLALSGQLDPRMHGRSGQLWGDEYSKRRSIYGFVNRFNQDTTLRNFDFPSPMQTESKRTENIVAPQALFLMNSPFVIEQSEALVASLEFDEKLDGPSRISAIYEEVFHREPVANEVKQVERFVEIEEGRNVQPWSLVAQSLFMSNEFLYVD